jgi:CSLREA domain-containing protein
MDTGRIWRRVRRARRTGRAALAALVAWSLVGAPFAAAPAAAAGLSSPAVVAVTSAADEPDASPGDGYCRSASGACTLRAAIQETNALAGPDTIVLSGATYSLTIGGAGEDAAATGDLDVRDALTLLGAGESATILDGGQLDRVLHVLNGAALRASGLTVRSGAARSGPTVDGSGGGIYNAGAGALTLTGVTVSGNKGDLGGGIATEGPARLADVALTGNEGDRGGGGLAARAAVTIVDGEVADNRSGRNGGGIGVFGPAASLTLTNSAVRRNSTTVGGGGIYNGDGGGVYGGPGTLTLSNVTVDGNRDAFGGGGGIMTQGPATLSGVTLSRNVNSESGSGGGGIGIYGGDATLTNVTVSGNWGYQGGGGIAVNAPGQLLLEYGTVTNNQNSIGQSQSGAGIAVGSGTSARLRNTVVSYNRGYAPLGDRGNCSGQIISLGNNQENGTSCGFTQSTDRGNARSDLASLADNGGPTETHSLLATSIAIDDGGCVSTIAVDQRGVSRPRDGNLNGTARCDEGSVEIDPAAPAAPSNLQVTEPWVDRMTLGWQDNSSNESGFRIRRKDGWPDSGSPWVVAGNVGANVTSFVDLPNPTLVDCTTYTYQVTARGGAEGAPSKTLAGTTLLRRPIALAVTPVSMASLRLTWEEYTQKEEAVVVERKTGAGAFQIVGAVGPNATSYQDVGLTPNTSYTYRLQARALGCASRLSDQASGTTRTRQAFTVDSAADAVDALPGDGLCQTAAGACTLRAAVQEANAFPGADTITVPAGVFQLSIPVGWPNQFAEDFAATGDLDIRDKLTIKGAGPNNTAVDGGGIDRVFHVLAGADVKLNGLSIRNGQAADEMQGGGVSNASGTLSLTNVVVHNNRAQYGGGGLAADGPTTLTDVTIRDNQGSIFGGGGVWVGGAQGALTATNSTISGNSIYTDGGGIYSYGRPVTLTNVTVSGNSSLDDTGGGILSSQGPLTLRNVTISGNFARQGGGGISASGVVDARNTIVTDNEAQSDPWLDDNCYGGSFPVAGVRNLEDGTSCFGGAAVANMLLGPLADNGGKTPTHALLPYSPAIDAGSNADCPATDQRSVARPRDGNGDGVAVCDVGAYER